MKLPAFTTVLATGHVVRAPMWIRRQRRGFTLFELVLVMAILVILAAIAVPSLDGMLAYNKVQAAADQIRGAWAEAQARAINEGRAYRFSVVQNKGNFRVAPDSADFWTGSASTPDSGNPNDPKPLVLEQALPKGVRFAASDGPRSDGFGLDADSSDTPGNTDPGQYNTIATFLPDGRARENVEITFTARGTKPVMLKLRGVTGVVTGKTLDN